MNWNEIILIGVIFSVAIVASYHDCYVPSWSPNIMNVHSYTLYTTWYINYQEALKKAHVTDKGSQDV